MYVHFYYHVFLLLIERHGVNRLFSKPILVPDLSGGEKLKRTAYIRHIHQPFQYRVELCCLKLFVPAIGCRQLELGHPLSRMKCTNLLGRYRRMGCNASKTGSGNTLVSFHAKSCIPMPRLPRFAWLKRDHPFTRLSVIVPGD